MDFVERFKEQIFTINEDTFEDSALAVFDFQYHQCDVYQYYCNSLGKNPKNVTELKQIPFLPIEFFKNHTIKSGNWKVEKEFKSSGTTSSTRSTHYIADLNHYLRITQFIFEKFFGEIREIQLLALLPSYLEQGQSSLIAMVDHFIKKAQNGSGYFMNKEIISSLTENSQSILIGVSYALLDSKETVKHHQGNLTLIETGGMKGRKKEITREELHGKLSEIYKPDAIWSEYGMTELLSQAYGKNGQFKFPKWAQVLIREINDPFCYLEDNKTGGINVIDLANIQSCSFIETKDLGKVKNGFFEVLGRFDNSDIRGCNLLV